MKVSLNATAVIALAGIAAVGFVAWKVFPGLSKVVTKDLNPASSENVVNKGVSAVGAAVTGDDSWTLGGQLADWFNPATREVNRQYGTPAAPKDPISTDLNGLGAGLWD